LTEQLAQRAGSAFFWRALQLAGTKAIFLVRTLILARLLVPEDFGLLAVSFIAVDFLLRLTNFGLIPALIQKPDPQERHFDAAWTVGIIRTLSIAVIVILLAPLLAALFGEPRAVTIIRVISIYPIFQAAASIKIAQLQKDLQFRSLIMVYLSEALANTLIAIALAPVWGVWALVAGALAGPFTFMVMSYVLAPYRPRFVFDQQALQPLVRFGRWIFLTGLVNVAATSTLQAVISRQLGAEELGLYFLAAKLAFIPAEVLAEVIGSVAFPVYARVQADARQAARIFRSMLVALFALTLPLCALLIALAPTLVGDLLGAKWAGTVHLIQILAVVNIIGLLGESIHPILQGNGRPDQIFLIEVIQSSLLIGLAWGLTSRYGVTGAALAWWPAIGASQFLSLVFLRRILPAPLAGVPVSLLIIAMIALLGGAIALTLSGVFPGLLGLVIAGSTSAAVMLALLWTADRRFALGLLESLTRMFPQITGWKHIPAVKS
jgi:O-antigen/teichoic acid export membrane protein